MSDFDAVTTIGTGEGTLADTARARPSEADIQLLRDRLREAEETLHAIRTGEVDAVVVQGPEGPRIYTLMTADQSYRMLVEQMRDPALMLCVDGTILYSNARLETLLGLREGSAAGVALSDLVVEEDRAELGRLIDAAAATSAGGEVRLVRAGAGAVPVRLSCSALRSGSFAGLSVIISDLSEEKRREMAEAASRAKSEFLAVMSHELRTPLNAITGHAQILEMGVHGPTTEAQRETIERIQRSARHLLGLIHDVLNFARLEGGRVEYDIGDVSLADALAEVGAMIGPQMEAKRLVYTVSVPTDTRVRADAEKLSQILLNLLGNAVKFTLEGGQVRVDCPTRGEMDDKVFLRVSDTGRGIPVERMSSIFEPFVQLHAERSGTTGVGLGLAIARDLALGMGGGLRVRSVLGEGSSFTLELPRASARAM